MGEDQPTTAHTMIGLRRLDNIQALIEDILEQAILGDLVETGVCRGGATIFMRAVLQAHQVSDRRVIACDTFRPVSPASMPWPMKWLLKGLASIPGKSAQRRIRASAFVENSHPDAVDADGHALGIRPHHIDGHVRRCRPGDNEPSSATGEIRFRMEQDFTRVPEHIRAVLRRAGVISSNAPEPAHLGPHGRRTGEGRPPNIVGVARCGIHQRIRGVVVFRRNL